MHVKLKKTLIASMITAFPICLCLQHRTVYDTLYAVLWGYSARHEELSHMINGGGIQSMINATAIVCLSASYAGIFDETGLLLPIQSVIRKIAKRSTAFCALMMTAILCCMISCNQTLAVMMTYSLCKDLDRDEESRSQQIALDLENTCIVIAPLIPWSIAGMVPLATVNAPTISILAAFYLYLIPLWQLFLSFRKKSRANIPAQG